MDVFNEAPAAPKAEDLVGEGKKFKTVDDLARGKVEADEHIKRLEEVADGLRAELDKRVTAAQELERIKKELQQRQDAGAQPKEPTVPALSASDIEALVEQKITAREANRTVAQNIDEANKLAIGHFGSAEAAGKAVKAAAAKRGVTVTSLKQIAAQSPSFFAEIVGVPVQPATQAVGSFVQPSAGAPDNEHVSADKKPGTYEYAESVRRADPRKYWSPAFQRKYVTEPALTGTYKIPK